MKIFVAFTICIVALILSTITGLQIIKVSYLNGHKDGYLQAVGECELQQLRKERDDILRREFQK